MFKVIIAGCRNFNDYRLLCEYADFKLSNIKDDIEIVSGHCRGADLLGERYAIERGYKLKLFPAEWSQYGMSAGVRRNKQMAQYADALIAYWDNQSKGTKNMIEEATKAGLKIGIKIYK